MKTSLRISKIFACIIFIQFAFSNVMAETITLAYHDYCPYTCDPNLNDGLEGYVIEIQKLIFKKAGITLKPVRAPWIRTIKGVAKGSYDAAPMVNPKHSDSILCSNESTAAMRQVFFIKKGDPWRYKGPESLKDIKVGNIIGYNYSLFSFEYEKYCQDNKGTSRVQYISAENGPLLNFKKILRGRITTFNEDADFMRFMTQKDGIYEQFEEAGQLGLNTQYMGFSPKNPNHKNYIKIFDQGIRDLRKNGKLKEILDRYQAEDWLSYKQ